MFWAMLGPETHPDEEGIKTASLFVTLFLGSGPETHPDEEGIKTNCAAGSTPAAGGSGDPPR